MTTKKPASNAPAVAPAVAPPAPGAPPGDLLDDLREIYKNLDLVDTMSMDAAQQQVWFDQYTRTRRAILAMESQALSAINQKLGQDADSVREAVDRCEKALHGVMDAAIVLQTVGAALGAIASIAALVA